MKLCIRCKVEKPLEEFNYKYKTKNIRQSYCRDCTKQLLHQHYKENRSYYLQKAHRRNYRIRNEIRTYIWKYLASHPCVDCGESNPVVLEFDHIAKKSDNISNLIKHTTLNKVVKEIVNCEVRCANCHRIKTAIQQGWNRKVASVA